MQATAARLPRAQRAANWPHPPRLCIPFGCSPAEFEGLVQRNLGANAGMDWEGLGALLRSIADRSLEWLAKEAAPTAAAAGGAVASASGAAQNSAAAEQHDPGFAGQGYHAFRLQRAALVLGELVAEQQRVDASSSSGGTGDSARLLEQGDGQQPPYHAAEAAANRACLQRIADALNALGLGLL